MGLVADDSSLVKVFANRFGRLAIQVAETVDTVASANGRSSEEFAESIEALEGHGDLRMHRIGTVEPSVASQHARGTALRNDDDG